MLDEEMDHMIREAADNHHPPYNDKAWEKMELKLDKHLPQKTDRRKWIFFLLFFLLLGAGFFFTINYFTGNKNNLTEIEPGKKASTQLITESLPQQKGPSQDQLQVPGNNNGSGNDADQMNSNPANDNNPAVIPGSQLKKDDKNNNANDRDNGNKLRVFNKGKTKIKVVNADQSQGSEGEENLTTKNNSRTGKIPRKLDATITGAGTENDEDGEPVSNSTGNKTKEDTKPQTKLTDEPGTDAVKVKKDEKEKVKEKEKALTLTTDKKPSTTDKKKPKKNFAGNFGLTVSVGPDLSFVELNKLGKATLMYGAGISYDLAKRLTLRTGFYFSKKIYSATPDQYHAVTYPYLTEIGANCKVYEIPVNLAYNFGQRKNHSWFGNVGLSSFIMKNEYYNYNYKTPTGQTYNYEHKVSNENKHYFAVLTLSGGYQYQFNKRISLQAEPYFKLPLSGIGLGKIKLNSSGVLFTVTVKPFAKGK